MTVPVFVPIVLTEHLLFRRVHVWGGEVVVNATEPTLWTPSPGGTCSVTLTGAAAGTIGVRELYPKNPYNTVSSASFRTKTTG